MKKKSKSKKKTKAKSKTTKKHFGGIWQKSGQSNEDYAKMLAKEIDLTLKKC